MDISLEARLRINGSFPAAVPGNTNELQIQVPGRGDRMFRLVKIKHLFGPGALPTPPRWPDLGRVQSKSTVLCYHEKLQLKKLIDLQSELLISSEIQIT